VIGAIAALLAIQGPDYPIQPVPFSAVYFEGGFWGPRLETNRTVTIPYGLAKCAETGRLDNFAVAGGLLEGAHRGQRYDDSDVYKLIEGAAYALALAPDPALAARLDQLIAWIAAAQEEDGYLYTARTIDPARMPDGTGPARFSHLQDSHELYCLGHLFEAAVAHRQATGKGALLAVAVKAADLLVRTFGPAEGQLHAWEGHQEVEIGLVKLYRATGTRAYLDLAQYFLDVRGTKVAEPAGMNEAWLSYLQAHQPPVQQTEAVGHAVRAGYMYSGMADVAALTGSAGYRQAIERLWQDVAGSKTYLTGGIGARANGEAFGEAFELPNATAYAETCAAVANALWNHRMFLLSGESRYVDVLERVLYNGFLSGVSLSGDRFFYPNPLARRDGPGDGEGGRAAWFSTSCCPVNVARMMPSVPGLQYAVRGDEIFVNLYQSGTALVQVGGREVRLVMKTDWPWGGKVDFTAEPTELGDAMSLTVHLRRPNGLHDTVFPSGPYSYFIAPAVGDESGFESSQHHLEPRARAVISFRFQIPVRRVIANERVAACRGRVAVEYGPFVYCVEAVDHGGRVEDLVLPDGAVLTPKWEPELLGGVMTLIGTGLRVARAADGTLRSDPAPLRMIPYFAWANRGSGGMAVWLPRTAAGARVAASPTLAAAATSSASHVFELDTLSALNDGIHPDSSSDHSLPRHTFWPRLGSEEWLRYDFAADTRISKSRVYWFDDTGAGRCRVPQSAQLEWLDPAGTWHPVNAIAPLGVAKDAWNEQSFAPVTTRAVRLRVRLREEASAGVMEWEVE
jgi:DUF1680 family protein